MGTIILVEDDQGLNEGIAFGLVQKGYRVAAFTHGLQCLNTLAESETEYDLAILDIGLPDIDGFVLAKRIKRFYHMPVIFLTAMDDEADMLEGYAIGCEDYITKPFSLAVLIERIKVALRRTEINSETGSEECCYIKDGLELDFTKKVFIKDGQGINLTAKEITLMETFLKHKNQILTKQQLLGQGWDVDGDSIDENTLSVNIRRLRKKIEKDPKNPKQIKTVFGIGYKWCD